MRVQVAVRALSAKYFKPRMFFTPGLELCPAGVPVQSPDDAASNSLSNLIDGIWLMAAPKSKVSKCIIYVYE